MRKSKADLKMLLAAATRLMHTPPSEGSEIIRMGDSRFRLFTDHHDSVGWLVVLVEERSSTDVWNDTFERYGLTRREMEVARLLVDRHSNKEIAERLSVTCHTAGRHTERVLRKLGLSSRRDVRAKLSC